MAAPPVWWEFEYDEWSRASEPWRGREVRPSVSYDIGAGLGEHGSNSYNERCEELYGSCLDAFCACCPPGDWIYAVDVQHRAFRFWPHRGRTTRPPWSTVCIDDEERLMLETFDGPGAYAWEQAPNGPWQVAPIPDGDDYLFFPQDFGWGLYAEFLWDAERNDPVWHLHVFGEPLLEAFAGLRPAAFSHPIGSRDAAGTGTSSPLIPLKAYAASGRLGLFRRFRRDHLTVTPLVTRITLALMRRRFERRRRWRSSLTAVNAKRLRRRFSLAAVMYRAEAALLNRRLTRRRR